MARNSWREDVWDREEEYDDQGRPLDKYGQPRDDDPLTPWSPPPNSPPVDEPVVSTVDDDDEKPKPRPTAQPWTYQGTGYQAPTRSAPMAAFERQPFEIPPPPSPPKPPPPPVDFMSLLQMGNAKRGAGYSGSVAPGAAADYAGISNQVGEAVMGPQYGTAAGSWQGENLLPELESFFREWAATPNRYTTPWMETVKSSLDKERKRGFDEGLSDIEGYYASRGLTGSNFEEVGTKDLINQLDENRLAELARVYENMANVEAQDRLSAGSYGVDVGQFGAGLGNDRRAEGQFTHEADRLRGRDFEEDQQVRMEADLEAARLRELADQYRYDFEEDQNRYEYDTDYQAGRDFELDTKNRADQRLTAGELAERSATDRGRLDLDTSRLAEEGTINRANLQLDSEAINQRAYEIQQDAIQRGQQMDLDEARDQAHNEAVREDMRLTAYNSERDRELEEWLDGNETVRRQIPP